MTDAMFSQLVENIRRDGCLTSVPLVCETQGGKLEVLSGNHRVMAAIKAGLEEADVMEVTTPLGREQRIAIQLSHNAIAGLDDPSILTELWADLDFAFKEYSGLTEEDLAGITEIDATGISVEAPGYEEITLAFLPEEKEAFITLLGRMAEAKTEARWNRRPLRRLHPPVRRHHRGQVEARYPQRRRRAPRHGRSRDGTAR